MKFNKQQLKELIKEGFSAFTDDEYLAEEETIEDKFFTCEDGESAGYWAGRLMKSMKGGGTNEEDFVRILKMKCAGQIKIKFDERYDEGLEQWIKDDFFGIGSTKADRKLGRAAIKRFNALGDAAQKMLDGLKLGDKELKKISDELDESDVIERIKKAEEFEEELSASNKVSDMLATAMGDKNFPYKKEYSDSDIGDVLDLAKKIKFTIEDVMEIYNVGARYSQISEKIRVGLRTAGDLGGAPKEKGDAVNESTLYEDEDKPWGGGWDKIKREREAEEKAEKELESEIEKATQKKKEKTERYETLAIDAERLVRVFEQKLKLLKKYYSRILGIYKRSAKGAAAKGSQAADGATGEDEFRKEDGPSWLERAKSMEADAQNATTQKDEKLGNMLYDLMKKSKSGNMSEEEREAYNILKDYL